MRRCESSEKSSARSLSAASLYEWLSSRIAPRIERSASTLAGRPRSNDTSEILAIGGNSKASLWQIQERLPGGIKVPIVGKRYDETRMRSLFIALFLLLSGVISPAQQPAKTA